MKYPLFTFLLITLARFSFGQQLPYVGPGQTFVFPNATNYFINSGSINWALDTEETYSFAGSNKVDNENIFNYIVTNALSGNLEAYSLRLKGFEGFENSTYSSYDKFTRRDLTKDEVNFVKADSLKTIKFHEVFYLDNYSLNCQIISAAPMTSYASGGVSLGLQEIFFCCKSIKDTGLNNNNLVHLKRIERVLNLDSIQNSKIIKQTYGLNLIQSMWLGASQDRIKIFDTKTNKIIASKDILTYSILDSEQVPIYDVYGSSVGYSMKAGQALFPQKLTNSIQFVQDFYYERKQSIFITTISDCYLFVKNWDDTNEEIMFEKRFKVLQ